MAEKRGGISKGWEKVRGCWRELEIRVLVLAWENKYPSHQNYSCLSTNVADSPHPFLLWRVHLKPSCYKILVFSPQIAFFFPPQRNRHILKHIKQP